MPFTVAHAAAALPLRRMKLVWSAFVIGTMAPDFETFLTFSSAHRDGHRFPGLLVFTFPAALIALWFFHWVLKKPLIELTPEPLRLRLIPYATDFSFWGVRRLAAIMGSLALGVATHLVWDSFTHSDSWMADRFEWLNQTENVPWFDRVHALSHLTLLQHASGVVGCAALLVWFVLWYRRAAPVRGARGGVFSPALRLVIVAVLVAVPWAAAALLAVDRGHEPRDFIHVGLFAKYLVLFPGTLLTAEVVVYAIFANWLGSQRWAKHA